jgi:hypothetical protein
MVTIVNYRVGCTESGAMSQWTPDVHAIAGRSMTQTGSASRFICATPRRQSFDRMLRAAERVGARSSFLRADFY